MITPTPTERPTRATRALLTTSAEEFANAVGPLLAAAAKGDAPASLLAVKVDPNGVASAIGENGQSAALREQVVELIRRNLRGSDIVAHASGAEVLVLLHGAAGDQGNHVAGRLCAAIRNHAFAGNGSERPRIGVTASMGVASAPRHGVEVGAVAAAARRACSAVSADGGDGSAIAPLLSADKEAPRPLTIDRFVGRTEELASLRRLLEEAIAGSPRAVAVIGEAGTGRGALLRQLEPEVRLRGGSLVIARAKFATVRTPYGIWSQVLQALRRLPDAPTRTWDELARLDPGIPSASDGRAGSKYRLLEELSEYIRLTAHSRPLVLILDEMQWADVASWDVLDHLLTQLERERILIGLTIRDDPGQTDIAERRRSLERIDYYHEIRLSRLTRDEVKRWVESTLRRQEVGRELLAYIYRHTQGNPLAIVQLLLCLVEEGSLWHNGERWEWTAPSELQLPTGVDGVIARRLTRFSRTAQTVLGTAAVIGREFEVDVLLATEVASHDAVRAGIHEAIEKDILQPNYERGGGGQAFTHVRIADAFVGAIPPDRLADAHDRVARALDTGPRSVEAAVHFDLAGSSRDAYRKALDAATHAESVYSYEAAGEYLQIAARNAASPGELAEVRVRLAQLAATLGRYDETEELCDLAIEWFAGQGDRHRALTLRRMRERARKELGEHARVTMEALQALDKEAESLGSVAERVEILTMLSQTYGRLGDHKEAERLAAECVKMAEQVDDDLLLAGALNRLAITVEQEDPRRARTYYERALELFQAVGNVRGQATCHSNLGIVAHLEGRDEDARKSLTIAIALARGAGMPDVSGMASLNLGVMVQKIGEHDRAKELYGDALSLFAAVKNSEFQLYVLFNMANLDRERRDFSSGAELYESTASLAQRIGQVEIEVGALAGEGICLLEMGQLDAARVPLAAVEHRMAGMQRWFEGRELAETLRIRVAAAEGRHQEALQIFEAARTLADRADVSSAAWLTASVADVLYAIDPSHLKTAIERLPHDVGTLGLDELTRKYQELAGLSAHES